MDSWHRGSHRGVTWRPFSRRAGYNTTTLIPGLLELQVQLAPHLIRTVLYNRRMTSSSSSSSTRAAVSHAVCWMMHRSPAVMLVLLILTDLTTLEGRPFGAPRAACQTLRPGHGTPHVTESSPYSLDVGAAISYSPGETIKVTITGREFKGFIMQARRADGSSTSPVGTFMQPPPYSKHLDCSNTNDTVTHANPSATWNMPFTWVAPDDSASDVIFVATIALEKTTYWMNVTSGPLAANYPTRRPDVSSATPVARPSTTGAPLYPTLPTESTISRAWSRDDQTSGYVFDNHTYVSTEPKQTSETTPKYRFDGAPTVSSGTGIRLHHVGLIYTLGYTVAAARLGLL